MRESAKQMLVYGTMVSCMAVVGAVAWRNGDKIHKVDVAPAANVSIEAVPPKPVEVGPNRIFMCVDKGKPGYRYIVENVSSYSVAGNRWVVWGDGHALQYVIYQYDSEICSVERGVKAR